MEKTARQTGKMFSTCLRISAISVACILLLALTPAFKGLGSAAAGERIGDIDQSSTDRSITNDSLLVKQLKGRTTGRTLRKYYARRQYLGSPPEIPHPEKAHGKDLECLICHANGGWTRLLKSMTPVTPHPELTACLQCHVYPAASALFRGNDWQSLPPPRLGRAYLPGAPPPIPHDIQMRVNCNACHVGPGTLIAIRMKHQWQGDCQQCHLPDTSVKAFRR